VTFFDDFFTLLDWFFDDGREDPPVLGGGREFLLDLPDPALEAESVGCKNLQSFPL
jgi:hypothetical protein